MSAEKSVAVFGAGPAGISAVRSLAELGHHVTWIYPEKYVSPRSIYTTSTEYPPLNLLIKPEQKVGLPLLRMLNDRGADVRVKVDSNKYFMLRNQAFINDIVAETERDSRLIHAEKLPQRVINGTEVIEGNEEATVRIDGAVKKYDEIVDATGIRATISSQVEGGRRAENFLVEYMYGARYLGHIEKPEMILVAGPAGGTSYVCPSADDPNSFDVVYSAWGPYKDFSTTFLQTANKRLDVLVSFLQQVPGISFTSTKKQDVYCGVIRSQATKKPKSNHVFAIGEAAGMARPTTGQSFDRSFRAGYLVAEAIDQNRAPGAFYNTWTKLWNDAMFLSGTIARLPLQKQGTLGTTFDRLQLMASTGKSERIMEKATAFFVDNKISADGLFYLFSDLKLLSSFLLVLSKHVEIAIKGLENSGIEWSLPPI